MVINRRQWCRLGLPGLPGCACINRVRDESDPSDAEYNFIDSKRTLVNAFLFFC